jgi:cytoskeletal protein CcmA (bactofilin family)
MINRLEHSAVSSESDSGDLVIGRGVRIQGSVHAPAGVQLYGTVEGDLHGGSALIGESGVVRGSLRASTADIHGEVAEDAEVTESIILRKTSRLRGELRYRSIEIEAGAKLTCSLKLLDEATSKPGPSQEERSLENPVTPLTIVEVVTPSVNGADDEGSENV